MDVEVVFYGPFRSAVGTKSITMELDEGKISAN